ncbi:helix-turn-helix domain-containing protein [Spirillospora sp. CA-128828]|uniref:helix-turn-helix domain-containing protein n=1 Tax=Spirillospora sp. CA-128828 TaxID=3240033 RepID=UPI003D9070CF
MTDDPIPPWAPRLAAAREARGWSKPATARALFRAAGLEPSKQQVTSLARQIRKYERGEHYPREWAAHYATVFETTEEELFGRSGGSDDNEDVDRRTLLGLMATATTVSSLARDAEPLRDAFEAAVAADISDRDADAWERVAHDYAREVGWSPAAVVQPELTADFAELTRLVLSGRGTARTRLIHVAAQLAALMAINLTNLGEGRAARRWWRTACRAADQTGDHTAAALVRGRAAVFSLYAQTPRLSVVEAAEEAIEVGRGVPCAGVVSGHAAKAQALAELGRHDEATETLDDLRSVFEGLPEAVQTERGSQWGWSNGRLHYVTSLVHTCAGNMGPAMVAQDAALAVYPDQNWQARGQIEMHRAGVLIRAGDVDEGARHMTRVLESLPAEQRCDGLVKGSALTSLRLAAPAQAGRPSIRQARDLLTSTGDR